jgi:hypothetical protein
MTAKMTTAIVTVNHEEQRYNTIGDYYLGAGEILTIRVSRLGDMNMEFCCAIHELVEAALCHEEGVSLEEIDEFDFGWHPHDGIEEPGDDPQAPYYRQHKFARRIERLVAERLGVDWEDYESRMNQLIAERDLQENRDDTHED